MNLSSKIKFKYIFKKFFKIIFPILFIIIFFELILRIIGFGDPVLYSNNNNYNLKPNQDVRRFKGSKIKINNFGMRSNNDWSISSNLNKILFFGDSVSFGGSYIDNENLFSERFCKMKKNSICGNYGTNGYKLENIVLKIEEVIKNIKFDHLIIVSSSSLTDGKSTFSSFPFYENFNYKFFKSTSEILNHFLFKHKIIDNYHKNKNLNKIKKNNEVSSINKIERIFKNLQNNKIKIDLFILPTLEDLKSEKRLSHFLENIDMDNINITNLYYEIYNQNYENLYFNNAHLNEKGHDYLSKLLYKRLK